MSVIKDETQYPDLSKSIIYGVYRYLSSTWQRDNCKPRALHGLIYVTDGSVEYHFPNQDIRAKAGDVLLFPKDIPYFGTKLTNDDNGFLVINFDAISTELSQLGLPICYRPDREKYIRSKFEEITLLWNDNKSVAVKLQCHAILYELLGLILADYHAHQVKGINVAARAAISYIESQYMDSSLSVNALCKRFFISPAQLRRSICQHCGISPVDYLHQIRISHAKSLLLSTNDQVQEIALQCGFSNSYYFCRLFKRFVGMSPLDYRHANIV